MSLSKECRVQGDCALWPGPNESVDQIAAPKQTYPSMHKVSDLPTVRMEAGHKRGYGLGATTLALTGRGLLMEGHRGMLGGSLGNLLPIAGTAQSRLQGASCRRIDFTSRTARRAHHLDLRPSAETAEAVIMQDALLQMASAPIAGWRC